jgi:hypothetical protein
MESGREFNDLAAAQSLAFCESARMCKESRRFQYFRFHAIG